MTRTLVTGATGTLGSALAPRLADAGQTVRGTSRSPPGHVDGVDEWVELTLPDGPGLEAAVEDVDVVVHAASDAVGDHAAVDARGTERLLSAAAAAGVDHVCYVSIVGIDGVPFGYYESKLAAEEAVTTGDVPWTIVRLTQFHPFLDRLAGALARLPVWPLPRAWRVQPIDVGEAADAVVTHATAEPAGRVPDVGGPAVRTVGDLAASYRAARGLRRPILRLPIPGTASRAIRDGGLTCPDRDVGTVTWEDYLDGAYP